MQRLGSLRLLEILDQPGWPDVQRPLRAAISSVRRWPATGVRRRASGAGWLPGRRRIRKVTVSACGERLIAARRASQASASGGGMTDATGTCAASAFCWAKPSSSSRCVAKVPDAAFERQQQLRHQTLQQAPGQPDRHRAAACPLTGQAHAVLGGHIARRDACQLLRRQTGGGHD